MDENQDKCNVGGGGVAEGTSMEVVGDDLQKSPEGPADGSVDNTPTREELIEKLKVTEAMLDQERQSRKESEEAYKKLKRKYARVKQMFRNEWGVRKQEWRRKKAELEALTGEEQRLTETIHEMKKTIVHEYSEDGRKLEEIRRLKMKVEKLQIVNDNRPTSSTLQEAANTNVPEVMAEREDAALIFPEEVWRVIFRELSDPKDLWHLTNTCHLFDNILSSWKTGWMLAQALPYIYKDLSGKKLLECREVCKSWNVTVDNFLEDHPSRRPHNSQNINPRRLDFVNPIAETRLTNRTMITFCNQQNPSILEDPAIPIMPPGRNPFIGRSVILNLREYKPSRENEDEDVKKLLDKATNFLTSFGDQILYLTVWLPPPEDGIHARIVQFTTFNMFQWLPNLRELCMDCLENFAPPAIRPGSLPTLANLETLHVYNSEESDPLSEARIEKYHSQLRKLCVTGSLNPFLKFCELEDWPNLRELQVSLITDLGDMYRLRNQVRMPQLSKLVLHLVPVGDDTSFEDLIIIIRGVSSERLLNTVRIEGRLDLLKLYRFERFEDYCRQPKSLKTLGIEHNMRDAIQAPAYMFLFPHFQFIENLHLFVRASFDVDQIKLMSLQECLDLAVQKGFQEVFEIVEVNKYAYRGEMYRSNIWELLPRLKVFSFQWDVYTRHGYEEYQEKLKMNLAKASTSTSISRPSTSSSLD